MLGHARAPRDHFVLCFVRDGGGGGRARAHHLVAAFGGEERAPASLKRLRGRAAGSAATLRVHPGGRANVPVWVSCVARLGLAMIDDELL